MNIYVARATAVLCKTFIYLSITLFTLAIVSWLLLTPIGIVLELTGNPLGLFSKIIIAFGSAPWGLITLYACIKGCKWICTEAFAVLERENTQTAIAPEPAPEPTPESAQENSKQEELPSDPVECV